MDKTTASGQKIPVNRTLLILILGFLATIDPFSIDFYLPAFAQIAKDLGTTPAKVSLSMSSYFIGLAIGQISYGPVLDRFGRKRPLYFGLAGYVLTCIGCTTVHSINALIIFRFIQALSGAVAGIGAFAMVRDFFPVNESAKIFSLIMLIIGISPLVAPSVGGFIASWMGWQFIFVVLALVVSVMIAVIFYCLPESHPPDPSVSLSPKPVLSVFFSVLKNRQFITYTLSGTFSFASLFIYLAGSPVIFLDVFEVSPAVFGLIFTLLSFGFVGSSQLNVLLLKRFKSEQIYRIALWVQIVVSAIFLVGILNNWYGLVTTIIILLVLLSCLGCINPNGSALALAPFTQNVGSASALMGSLQIGISALISGLIGLLDVKSILPVALMMAATSLIALLVLGAGLRSRAVKSSLSPSDT